MFNKDLEELKIQLELEGYVPDTPKFEFLYLERKVKLCQARHLVTACRGCSYYEDCKLVKQYVACVVYKEPPPKCDQ